MAIQLPANATWFTFESNSTFSVYAFTGQEEVNKPYEFSIELVSRSADEDLVGLLGTEGVLAITDRSGATRHVHGLIREIEQLHIPRITEFFCKIKAVLSCVRLKPNTSVRIPSCLSNRRSHLKIQTHLVSTNPAFPS